MNPTDLKPEDIYVEEFTALDGGKGYRAYLGFIIHQGGVRMYQGTGFTPHDAKHNLAEVMKRHLDQAAI